MRRLALLLAAALPAGCGEEERAAPRPASTPEPAIVKDAENGIAAYLGAAAER